MWILVLIGLMEHPFDGTVYAHTEFMETEAECRSATPIPDDFPHGENAAIFRFCIDVANQKSDVN